MKNLFTQLFKGILLTGFIFTSIIINSETKRSFAPQVTSEFLLSVQNLNQTAPNTIEFDVYLLNTKTAAAEFQLATLQLGFLINSGIHTGGILTATPVNTNSGIIASLQFIQPPNNVVSPLISLPAQTLIRQQGNTPPGAGRGSIISSVSPGTLITHYVITNSVNFIPYSTPDLTFISDSNPNIELYNTSISEYISNVNTNLTVTPGVDAIVIGNPVLNVATNVNKTVDNSKMSIYTQNKNILVNCTEEAKQIFIYNSLGSMVKTDLNVKGLKIIDMINAANEYYIVKVITQNNVYSERVLLK
jgi:hypothetical protein